MNFHPILRWLLWPFSALYMVVAWARAWLYAKGILRPRRLKGAVLSVGNLTVGGTGKTSLVIWLVERLLAEGKRVGVLTRGYGGKAQDARGVPQSDEPWMLWMRWSLGEPSGNGPQLGIGASRYRNGQALERKGVEWFVLDDGFQHLQLARDVDIVLLDATDPFGGGFWLPAGPLREPKSALRRADILVLTRSEHAPALEAVVRRYTQSPVFYARAELEGLYDIRLFSAHPSYEDCRGKKLFAFCAIGNRRAFFDDLRRWGLHVVGEAAFRDHHRYSPQDVQRLASDAKAAGADALVCTEKDVCNFLPFLDAAWRVYVCRTRLQVSHADQFWKTITQVIQQRRAGALP
jgi:tetraacyldisaccharide 4'-kinase